MVSFTFAGLLALAAAIGVAAIAFFILFQKEMRTKELKEEHEKALKKGEEAISKLQVKLREGDEKYESLHREWINMLVQRGRREKEIEDCARLAGNYRTRCITTLKRILAIQWPKNKPMPDNIVVDASMLFFFHQLRELAQIDLAKERLHLEVQTYVDDPDDLQELFQNTGLADPEYLHLVIKGFQQRYAKEWEQILSLLPEKFQEFFSTAAGPFFDHHTVNMV